MNTIFKKIWNIGIQERAAPVVFLFAALLIYGTFFWQMGFYWDDLPISWIRYQFGTETMRLYFSTSRPVWGELYQITTRLIPQIPMYWQLFAVFWRWLGVVVLWMIIKTLRPGHAQFAFVTSLLFLFYPGFNQQWVSFLFSHFFIVLFFFLFSYLIMLWSFLYPKWYWPLTLLAVLFSALNVWMMEYFYSLELIRPFIILLVLLQKNPFSDRPRAILLVIWDVAKKWSPYLAVLVLNVIYRMFVFSNLAYKNELLSDLQTDFLGTSLRLIGEIFSDIWLVGVKAWAQIFYIPNFFSSGPRTIIFYVAVLLILFLAVILFRSAREELDRRSAWWIIGLGLIAMAVGGGPYWLAKLDISLSFPANRFVISFMLGASLFLAGMLELFPMRFRIALIAVFISFAAGRHTIWADEFRRDWSTQKSMFWQMVWRAPGLKPDTIVMMNEGALNFYADNSLGAALNWIYDPANQSKEIHYTFFYPTNRLNGALPKLELDIPVEYTFLIGKFLGNTSQAVVFYYSPPRCLRLLDPEIDVENRLIPDDSLLRDAAVLSSTAPILSESMAKMPEIYGPEPVHGWCYFFEKAELARQLGDWKQVVVLGDKAFALGDHPNDPIERFVFIEGYAHMGDWEKASELSMDSYAVSKKYTGPLLCKLWDRIARETEDSSEQNVTLDVVQSELECLP